MNALSAISRGLLHLRRHLGVLSAIAAYVYLPATFGELGSSNEEINALEGDPRLTAVLAVLIGIVLAAVILWLTGHYTGTDSARPSTSLAPR